MAVLDLIRLLIDKDARDMVGKIMKRVSRTPQWKKDLWMARETFKGTENRESEIFVEFIERALTEKGWAPERARVARYVAGELIQNAFIHGVSESPGGKVRVTVVASSESFRITVQDSGRGFGLDGVLERQKAKASGVSKKGLSHVQALASFLDQTELNCVEAEVTAAETGGTLEEEADIRLISFSGSLTIGRMDNPSVRAAFESLENSANDRPVVVNLKAVTQFDSYGVGEIVRALRILSRRRVRFAVCAKKETRSFLRILRLDWFDIFDDVSEAQAFLRESGAA